MVMWNRTVLDVYAIESNGYSGRYWFSFVWNARECVCVLFDDGEVDGIWIFALSL